MEEKKKHLCFNFHPCNALISNYNLQIRHGKTGESGRVRVRSIESLVKTSHFKRVKKGFGSIGLWVGLACIFHMNFFF